MIFSASADLLNSRGMIIPRALHKSADAEKITIKLLVTDIYISNFSQAALRLVAPWLLVMGRRNWHFLTQLPYALPFRIIKSQENPIVLV